MTFDDIVKMMITKKYIITIILIFSIPSMAKNCPVDDVKLSQIKTYITCTVILQRKCPSNLPAILSLLHISS